jgi:hypothetical protein
MKDNLTHEENMKKELEILDNISNFTDVEVSSTEFNDEGKVSNLGQVDPTRGRSLNSPDDPEVKRLNELIGHQRIELSDLPSGGRFYRHDFEILIRPARVSEVRDFSTIDETNLRDVDEKINSMLVSCAKIMYGTAKGSYKDILEEDRIYVILKIRELTFKEGEQKLMMPVSSKKCKTSSCGAQDAVELKTHNLQFSHPDDTLEKYYDSDDRCFKIETKEHGVIVMAPPTIGVMRAITDYIRDKEEKGQPWDRSSLQILPFMQREWRGWEDKDIFAAVTSFQGWNTKKFSLILRLAEMMKVGVKPEMYYSCNSCGAEVTVPLTFPGGIRALFIISDITSELL